MDTKQLEKFAQAARRKLHEQVAARLDRVLTADSADLRAKDKTLRELEEQIAASSREAVVEKVAYIWFNRFCALRYMDVNHYTRVGIVSPVTSPTGEAFTQPEILQEAKQGVIDERFRHTVNAETVTGLLSGRLPSADPQQEAYRLLLVGACNAYHDVMPFMFEEIDDYTELLMPDDLLSRDSILQAVREALTAENCADVEVIGWLYQFYISEKKDEVMGRKGKVASEDIPAVTQLFTPHWIVRYMVENSLGRLWMLNHPNSRLVEQMDYYIEPENSEVCETSEFLRVSSPEEIRLCDPAAGSGHILTYAFDLLYAIYEEQGYNPVDIPRLILERNLTGVEIDERAGALAGFALMMKARERDSRFFRRGVQPEICVMEDVSFTPNELDAYMEAVGHDLFTQNVQEWLQQFERATTFGSLIRPLVTDTAMMRERLEEVGVFENLFLSKTNEKLRAVLRMTEALSPRYHVVVANPPYMGSRNMNRTLKRFAKNHFPVSKSDLFAMFIERGFDFLAPEGYNAMVTMQSWMFLSSYKKLRKKLLKQVTVECMVHMANMVMGIAFGTAATIWCKVPSPNALGHYSYVEYDDLTKENKPREFPVQNERLATATAIDFGKIPGAPIAYWISDYERELYEAEQYLGDVAYPKKGMDTGENAVFLRFWYEVSRNRSCFDNSTHDLKWYPYNKGGKFRRWYGNRLYVVNWENNGRNIKARSSWDSKKSNLRNSSFYFREGFTWTTVSSGGFSARYCPEGALFDNGGCTLFADRHLYLLGAFINSRIASRYLEFLSPTLNFQPGDVSKILFPRRILKIEGVKSQRCIDIARVDWNAYTSSWEFSDLPLLHTSSNHNVLADSYVILRSDWRTETTEMQRLEEQNNRIFIEAYGLEDELSPEVPLSEITLTCNPHYRYGSSKLKTRNWSNFCDRFPETCERLAQISAELAPDMPEEDRLGLEQRLLEDTMKEFISYAVGCMFGRYSLDKPGLILANQGETLDDYVRKVSDQEITFMPDADNVIPMLDGDWFPDDVTERFKKFLRVTFGEAHYEENLAFIELALNRDIRGYFLRNFYDDHVRTYSKRPIYWLFSSPSGSFNALIYMHRYRSDTVSVVLNDYLREYRTKLEARQRHLEHVELSGETTKQDKTKAVKEIGKIEKILKELREYEDEALFPLAIQQIDIDLDDGVLVNYNKFGEALEHVRGLSGR